MTVPLLELVLPCGEFGVVPGKQKAETLTRTLFSELNSKAFGLPVNASQGGLLAHHASLGSGGGSTLPGRLVLQERNKRF